MWSGAIEFFIPRLWVHQLTPRSSFAASLLKRQGAGGFAPALARFALASSPFSILHRDPSRPGGVTCDPPLGAQKDNSALQPLRGGKDAEARPIPFVEIRSRIICIVPRNTVRGRGRFTATIQTKSHGEEWAS